MLPAAAPTAQAVAIVRLRAAHQHSDLAAVLLVAEAAAAQHDVDLVAQVREERGVERLRGIMSGSSESASDGL